MRCENVSCNRSVLPRRISLGRKHHVKTITRSFAGSGVHLRDSERARTAADSSTNVNSARQRHDKRPDRSVARESTGGLGIWSQWHFTVTTDGGETWNAGVVPGAEALQFRDVQAFSARVAYLMSIGNNPTDFRVYKTLDGGATWTIQFENQNPSGFYDAFAFWTPHRGILIGDSINGVS